MGRNHPPRRVALIEFGEAHSECLHAQCRFLEDAGCEVHLLVHPALHARLAHLAPQCHALPIDRGGFLGALGIEREATGYLLKHGIDRATINTASGWAYRLFTLRNARRIRLVAIAHDLDRLRRSFTQRLVMGRLSAVLVLAERLEEPCRLLGKRPVGSFYPAWFPPAPLCARFDKPAGARWFAVVGQIETKRRAYDRLLAAADAGIDTRARIFVLGEATCAEGREVVRRIRNGPSRDRFTILDEHVDDDLLHGIIARCDGVLPLIEGRDRYVRAAVSGAFNLAYGYRLPLLLEAPIADPADEIGRHAIVPEGGEGLAGLISRMCETPEVLAAVSAAMRADHRLSFRSNRDRYLAQVLGSDAHAVERPAMEAARAAALA